MKRSLFTAGAALLLSGTLLAGGILTNTNQSAMYTRMGMRHATTEIDAVYFNPAGLTKLENGLHFSINNQTIGQTRTITSDYAYLNEGEYIGEIFAPLFPSIFGAFKFGKLAVSAGFMPIGGGGGATYETGLPSFEYSASDLPTALTNPLISQTVDGYSIDAFFEGSSTFFGYQANISYEINDMISIAVGARYVTAKETYMGHLNDMTLLGLNNVTMPAAMDIRGDAYFSSAATNAQGGADALSNAMGLGLIQPGDPLADPTAIQNLTIMGLYQAGMTNLDAATAFGTAAVKYGITSTILANQDVDAVKTASGITPIVSVNIQPIDMLNVAIRYELATKLEFTNETEAGKEGTVGFDPSSGQYITMFPDGAKTRLDLPAMLTVGATLQPIEALLVSAGMTYYFDKDADWNGREDLLDANTWDIGIGGEFALNDKLKVSAGWSMTKTSPGPNYQTDLSYTLPTQGISFGIGYNIMENIQLNLGGQYVIYETGSREFQHDFANAGIPMNVTETLEKGVWIAAVGLNISLAR
jgi:long-chain fatty acid transport protein